MTKQERMTFLGAKRAEELDYNRLVTLCHSCRYFCPGIGQTYYDGYDPPECDHPLPVIQERYFHIALSDSGTAEGIGGGRWGFRLYRKRAVA